jgi:ribosomal protein S18 acetylase RimI-like enzyme
MTARKHVSTIQGPNSRISRQRAGDIAEKGREIAGFLWLVWYKHIRHKGIAYIEELHVTKRFRRQGIGKLLVQGALNAARKKDILTVLFAPGIT